MGSRRSERSHKVINYAKLVGSEDDNEDFADFCDNKASKKRARLEDEDSEKNVKLLKESKKVTADDVYSSQNRRLSLEDRVFERQVKQAITASKGLIVKHVVFDKSKPNNTNENDIASDDSYKNTDNEDEDDEYTSVSSSDYEGDNNEEAEDEDDDFKPKSSSQGKQNQKTRTTTKGVKNPAKHKTKQLSVVIVDMKRREVQASKSTVSVKDCVLGESVSIPVTMKSVQAPAMNQTNERCLSLDVERKHNPSIEDESKHSLRLDVENRHNLIVDTEKEHNLSLEVEMKHDISLEGEKKHNISLEVEKNNNLSLEVEKKHNLSLKVEKKHNLSLKVEKKHNLSLEIEKKHNLSLEAEKKHNFSLEVEKKHNHSLELEKKHNLSLGVERKHNPEDKHDINLVKDAVNPVSAEQNAVNLLRISPRKSCAGSKVSEAKTEHDEFKIIAKATSNCVNNIERSKNFAELKLPSFKPTNISKKENLNSSKVSSSITNVKLINSKENAPAIKSYTSPFNISPKGIRIGLSRKVIKPLHPGVRKPL